MPSAQQRLFPVLLPAHLSPSPPPSQALKVIVRYWEDVPAAYGSAQVLLLQYLLAHPGPLSSISAVLMALRAEVRHRQKKRPTQQLEAALEAFQLLQVGLGWPQGPLCCFTSETCCLLAYLPLTPCTDRRGRPTPQLTYQYQPLLQNLEHGMAPALQHTTCPGAGKGFKSDLGDRTGSTPRLPPLPLLPPLRWSCCRQPRATCGMAMRTRASG